MAHIRPQTWLLALAIAVVTALIVLSAQAQGATATQTYFRRVVMERRPTALVMATPSNTVLTAETKWKGHVLTMAQAYPLVKRGNIFLVEPMDNGVQLPPTPFVSSSVAAGVIQDGRVRYGLYVTGRKVVLP